MFSVKARRVIVPVNKHVKKPYFSHHVKKAREDTMLRKGASLESSDENNYTV